jgi:hypothetical protein
MTRASSGDAMRASPVADDVRALDARNLIRGGASRKSRHDAPRRPSTPITTR